MARISTGKSEGVMTRATSQRLLGGMPQMSSGGAIATDRLATAAIQPQAQPVNTFIQTGAPTLGGPVRIPELPAIPRPNQDLAALADALGSFNSNLQQFGTSVLQYDKRLEEEAQQRGAMAAAKVARFGGFKDYSEAVREVEKKAAVDPTLMPLLTELRSLDPRALPYASAEVADSLVKQRMATLKEDLARTTKLPDGRPLESVPQDDPAFFDLMVSKALPEGISPSAVAKNQANLYSLFGSVRADQAKRHADFKGNQIRMGFNRSVGGATALMASGQLPKEAWAGNLSQQLTALYNLDPQVFKEEKDKLIDTIAETVRATAGGDTGLLQRLAPEVADALEMVVSGPNGTEPLIDQFGTKTRAVVINELYRKITTGVVQDRELQTKVEEYRGQDQADNDIQQYLPPAVLNDPAQLQARIDALPQRAAQLFPNDPDAQLAYQERVQKFANNYSKAYIAPIQRDAAAGEYARQAMNPSSDPMADIQRYTQMSQAGLLDESTYKSLIAGARARNEKKNDRNYDTLKGLQRDLQQQLTEQFRTTNEGDGTFAVTPKEAVEIRKAMGDFYRAGENLILQNPGANLDQQLGTLFQNLTMPAIQKQQSKALQPASRSPEAIAKTFGPGRGKAADNANLRRQIDTRPLYPVERAEKQLDSVLLGKPLDEATRQIIRRAGMKPSDFFIRQMELHGVPLDPEVQQQLRKLDGSDLVSSLGTGTMGGMGMINPARTSGLAQRLWQQWGTAVANALVPPAAAAERGTSPFMGSGPAVLTGRGFNALLSTIRSGEGGWNSVNRGTAGDSSPIRNLSQTAIGAIEDMQKRGRVFAVGAYQFTPGVLTRARKEAGLSPNAPFTPENQSRMATALILGSKRPALADYIRGKSDDLNAAHREIALEWAALQGPSGRGMYDGDKAGNMASIRASQVRAALQEARRAYLMRR